MLKYKIPQIVTLTPFRGIPGLRISVLTLALAGES